MDFKFAICLIDLPIEQEIKSSWVTTDYVFIYQLEQNETYKTFLNLALYSVDWLHKINSSNLTSLYLY
jgi:hypothetical protein